MRNPNLISNILTLTIKPKYKLNNLYHKNLDKICWIALSRNPNISHLIYNLGINSYKSFNNYL